MPWPTCAGPTGIPFYAFVRRRGYEAREAQDLTQDFFARLLEKQVLKKPGPGPDSDRRLYCLSWQNPRPEAEVASIDFMPCDVPCEPFLVALTAEP